MVASIGKHAVLCVDYLRSPRLVRAPRPQPFSAPFNCVAHKRGLYKHIYHAVHRTSPSSGSWTHLGESHLTISATSRAADGLRTRNRACSKARTPRVREPIRGCQRNRQPDQRPTDRHFPHIELVALRYIYNFALRVCCE